MVDGVEIDNPDYLFTFTQAPSAKPGKQVGTIDEVVYALKSDSDPRFAQEPYAEDTFFSADVQKVVDDRYLRLAASNEDHFAEPGGHDHAGAGSTYRDHHEQALGIAFAAGQSGGDPAPAEQLEAAAQHYLTDAFAAGHLRTARGGIKEHYDALYPAFWTNFKKSIALSMTAWIDRVSLADVTSDFYGIHEVFGEIYGEIRAKTQDLPRFGFGEIISKVAHDRDNVQGVPVENDLGDAWTALGDDELEHDDATRAHIVTALQLGMKDVDHAYALGGGASQTPTDLLEQVRARTPAPASAGAKYGAEQMIPRPRAEAGDQSWQFGSLDELWDNDVRSDEPGQTYGKLISQTLRGGEVGKKLADFASEMDATVVKYGVTIYPQAAYREGFLEPLLADPKGGLAGIIDFSPGQGAGFMTRDGITEAEIEMSTDDDIADMTLTSKAQRITDLLEGRVSGHEGDLILRLFGQTAPGDRAALYAAVEGHPWTGAFRDGVFTVDDDLVDGLSSDQLDQLADIIDGRFDVENGEPAQMAPTPSPVLGEQSIGDPAGG